MADSRVNKTNAKVYDSAQKTQIYVDNWIKKYEKNFIAVPIRHCLDDYFNDQEWEKDTLDSELLECPEARLRRKHRLEYSEKGKENIKQDRLNENKKSHSVREYKDSRSTSVYENKSVLEQRSKQFMTELPDKILDISTILKDFTQSVIKRPIETYLSNESKFEPAFLCNYLNDKEVCDLSELICKKIKAGESSFAITLSNGKEHRVTSKENGEANIEGLTSLNQIKSGVLPGYTWNYTSEKLAQQYRIPKRYKVAVQVAADMSSPNPIDKNLAQIWELKKTLKTDQSLESLCYDMIKLRILNAIQESEAGVALRFTMDIQENDANDWRNANLIILRGAGKNLVSAMGNCLLTPWENKGEFCALPLNQKDTIVLGPKAILEPYVQKQNEENKVTNATINHIYASFFPNPVLNIINEYSNKNYFYFEDLSLEQLNFFNVPERLRHREKVKKEDGQKFFNKL